MKHETSIKMALKEETYRKVDLDGIVNLGFNNSSEHKGSKEVVLQVPEKMSNDNGYQSKDIKNPMRV